MLINNSAIEKNLKNCFSKIQLIIIWIIAIRLAKKFVQLANTLFNTVLGENDFYFYLKLNELFGQPNTYHMYVNIIVSTLNVKTQLHEVCTSYHS